MSDTIFTYGDTQRGDLASMKRIIVGEPAEPPQRLVQLGIDHDAPPSSPAWVWRWTCTNAERWRTRVRQDAG